MKENMDRLLGRQTITMPPFLRFSAWIVVSLSLVAIVVRGVADHVFGQNGPIWERLGHVSLAYCLLGLLAAFWEVIWSFVFSAPQDGSTGGEVANR